MKEYMVYIKPQFKNQVMLKNLKQMNKRMDNIANRFGDGLKKAAKNYGNVLNQGTKSTVTTLVKGLTSAQGIIISLVAAAGLAVKNMIQPYEKLLNQMKSSLGNATDIKDMVKMFNTSAEKYLIGTTYAQSKGVTREEFNSAVMRFVEILKSDKEIEDKGGQGYFTKLKEYFTGDLLHDFMTASAMIGSIKDTTKRTEIMNDFFGTQRSARFSGFVTNMKGDVANIRNRFKSQGLTNNVINENIEKGAGLDARLRTEESFNQVLRDIKFMQNTTNSMITNYSKAMEAETNTLLNQYKNFEGMQKIHGDFLDYKEKALSFLATTNNKLGILNKIAEGLNPSNISNFFKKYYIAPDANVGTKIIPKISNSKGK